MILILVIIHCEMIQTDQVHEKRAPRSILLTLTSFFIAVISTVISTIADPVLKDTLVIATEEGAIV